ncbi:MAG: amino acid adenylation domain-containing protein [Polyangiales bacterium]
MTVSFLSRFEAQADLTPHVDAVTFEGRSLSYVELDQRSNRLAHRLITDGVAVDGVVAIAAARSLETMVFVLAVLKAGAGYLPLDPSYPHERLAFMLADSRASLLLGQPGLALALDDTQRVKRVELSIDDPLLTEGDASRLPRRHRAESLAYAIYTSGSTGKPKGVAMVHRALDNLITWQLEDSAAGEGTVTLQFAPLSFDVHFQEMFGTWCGGGRLVLLREALRLEMLSLLDLLEKERVERLFLPFIALQSLADIAVAHDKLPTHLAEIITAGEQLQVTRALVELFTRLPGARLFNHYGPSETHVVTSLLLEGAPSTWPALPPIGRALPNVTLRVLDPQGHDVLEGEEGELFIGGLALARGYLHRPELTEERFVTRASEDGETERFYRTGDLVKELDDGIIQFLGRLDGQVKIRGYRIEIGEIEVALSAYETVKEAAVTVYEPRPSDKRLVAYLVVEPGHDPAALRRFLEGRLPDYMLPSAFVIMKALPRTPSGKVDKRALPPPSRERPLLAVEHVPPRGEHEPRVAEIWTELLSVDGIGTHDNFFELGGNSLLALKAVAAIQKNLGVALPITQFFERPTIAAQAAFVADPTARNAGRVRRTRSTEQARAPVAIIGMAGRFPGADTVDALFANLRAGIASITRFAPGDIDPAVSAEERDDPLYVPARGVLAGAEHFDASFFGVSPSEASVLDPQQRILLELSWNALEHAGYAPSAREHVVGVYAGTHNNTYYANAVQLRPDAIAKIGTFATMVASEKDYVATRIAHKLDLTGPALSIHTACSTSLVAIITGVQHLRTGLCELAIAGGASLTVPQQSGHLYQEGGMLSRDGITRSFDAEASGTTFSDGAAMVVLKRLDDAVADGDTIYAVIRGVGLNNDGGHKASFTAPSIEGQLDVIAMAQDDAGIAPRSLSYVEAHGTATPLGDPIEVEALTRAFRRGTDERGFCGLGSIKSNLGHLTAAAGVAGVLKVALALEHEELPPSLGFRKPNPNISFADSPFYVVERARPWPRGTTPRRAGVSSFGVGGTNAHVVLEEAPTPAESGPSIAPQLILVSAKTPASLERGTAKLAEAVARLAPGTLADAAYTLAVGRVPFAERRAVVARSAEEAAQKLASASEGARAKAAPVAPALTFMFPGQGAQYPAMGQNLYQSEPTFRLAFDQCAEALRVPLDRDLREVLYGELSAAEASLALRQTELTQTALFAIEYALARTLMGWGLTPSFLVGHSVGEFVAATLAGVFSLEDALGVVAARGKLMQRMAPGAMLSVRAGADQLRETLPPALDIACENAAGLSVVSGPHDEIRRYQELLATRDVAAKELATSHAFHSRSMDPAVALLRAEVAKVKLSAPSLRIVSTATGAFLTDAEATSPDYWASHMRRTVRFQAALAVLASQPDNVLVEVGPGRSLTTLATQRVAGDTKPRPVALSTLPGKVDDDAEWVGLLGTLGRLWVSGVPVDFRAYYGAERRHRVPLPGTSFEPTRHWLERPARVTPITAAPALQVGEPAVHRIIDSRATPTGEAPSVRSNQESEVRIMSSEARSIRLVGELKQLFEDTSGIDFADASADANFLELGVDSLLITQLANRLKSTYKLPITFRQLMEDAPTFAALAGYLDAQLPPEAAAPASAPPAAAAPPQPALAQPAFAQPAIAQPALPNLAGTGGVTFAQTLIQLQVAQMALFQQQLALLMPGALGAPAQPTAPQPPVTAAIPTPTAIATPEAIAKAPQQSAAQAPTPASGHGQNTYDPQKAFGAIARIYKQSDAMTPRQLARLKQLEERYTRKTGKSKAHTQQHRKRHADPRVVTGFKPRIKEIIYPIVTSKASGCRLWDLDGNEYIDALNGFGSNFFGYSAPFIAKALHERIDLGFEIGPQTPLAGESAELVCELTRMDRAAFCNTGSEAVMGALRIARTVTGRSLVVAFSGSYHGIFDEVIVRDTKSMKPIPASPGILPGAVQNMLILEYGTDQTLQIIRERADELAAVLVEPVQSRRPDFQPKAFLQEVRAITKQSGSALIFDEVITGFRSHPGGAQAWFGIDADLATYGKVPGGGMAIGVIAGRDPWMDALDGGHWQYGDDSTPTAGVTYFAGTFVRHPMTMAATHAALSYMKAEGPALQQRLNDATTQMAQTLNSFFKSVGAPLEIRHFASLWKTFFTEPQPYGELLFCYMRDRGLHIWDGFPCFLTLAHGEREIAFIVDAFKESVREMQAGQFLPGGEQGTESLDASQPPVPGARLGRDPQGNPAWFVPNPEAPGKYLRVS